MKAALSQNPSEPQVRAVELFADLVSEGTEGRIRVQVYPNNQLGNQRDVVEGLQMGSIELANDPYGANFAKGSVSVRAMYGIS